MKRITFVWHSGVCDPQLTQFPNLYHDLPSSGNFEKDNHAGKESTQVIIIKDTFIDLYKSCDLALYKYNTPYELHHNQCWDEVNLCSNREQETGLTEKARYAVR